MQQPFQTRVEAELRGQESVNLYLKKNFGANVGPGQTSVCPLCSLLELLGGGSSATQSLTGRRGAVVGLTQHFPKFYQNLYGRFMLTTMTAQSKKIPGNQVKGESQS